MLVTTNCRADDVSVTWLSSKQVNYNVKTEKGSHCESRLQELHCTMAGHRLGYRSFRHSCLNFETQCLIVTEIHDDDLKDGKNKYVVSVR